jgi:hypothetical protein
MFIRTTVTVEMVRVEECIVIYGNLLPIKDRREELGNQALIVWAEGLSVNRVIALAV